jgi:hypothetical protein
MTVEGTNPDHQFVIEFRMAVERYLCALDEWQTASRNCYLFSGYPVGGVEQVEAQLLEYQKCRRELETMLPRARQLCSRFRRSDPFLALLEIGATGGEPGIARSVRAAVSRALIELHAACTRPEWRFLPHLLKGQLIQRLAGLLS